MSFAGRWMRRVRLGSCADRASRDQDASQIGPPHSRIPLWESLAAHPEEKRGSAKNIKPPRGGKAEKRLTQPGRIEKSPDSMPKHIPHLVDGFGW